MASGEFASRRTCPNIEGIVGGKETQSVVELGCENSCPIQNQGL